MSVIVLEQMGELAKEGLGGRRAGDQQRGRDLTVCDDEGGGTQKIVELLLRGDLNRRPHCGG